MRVVEDQQVFTSTQACAAVKITYRQLDHWVRKGLVRPSVDEGKGSGRRRLFSAEDVVHLWLIRVLLGAGFSLGKIQRMFDYVKRELREVDLESAHLIISGDSVALVSREQLVEVLSQPGQGMLNICPLGDVAEIFGPAVVEKVTVGGHETADIARRSNARPDLAGTPA